VGRGFLKVWNVSLVLGSFFLTIFGTFLTRSGLISSVHAFAQSEIGIYFVGYMIALAVFCVGIIVYRLPKLSAPSRIDSVLSREAMFVVNNWMLVGICAFILLATTWPKVSESLWDERLTVGASFYNAWLAPLGLILFAIIPIGMLTPWRKASKKNLIEAFRDPLIAGLSVAALHITVGARIGFAPVVHVDPIYDVNTAIKIGETVLGHFNVGRSLAWLDGHLPVVATGLFAFNIAALMQEFYRGISARVRLKNESPPVALTRLVGRNRRRYGGYIVHIGFALMMLGYMGAAYRQESEGSLSPGQSIHVGHYTLRYDGPETRRTPATREVYAKITAFRDGREFAQLRPARFVYTARPDMPTTEVSITPRFTEDLYVVLATLNNESHIAHIKGVVNPLTVWIWIGGIVIVLGVITAMWPDASKEASRALSQRKTVGGGAATVAGLMLLVMLVPLPADAQNRHASGGGSPPPVGVSETFTPRERHLFDQLLCMCGDCARLPLATCSCDFAAHQRDTIRAKIGSGETDANIVDRYVERFGAASLTVPPDRGHNKALYVMPIVALFSGAGLVVYLARKWTRREAVVVGKTDVAASPQESQRKDAYDARIDDELRGDDD
jgi:cytochrome c-type biogenesis protein CcmF